MQNPVGMQGLVRVRPKHLPSVRTFLTWLVLACFVPVLLGCVFLLFQQYQLGREQLHNSTVQTARALVQAVDAQLAKAELAAQALATSDALVHHDFLKFHQQAQRLLQDAPFAQSVLIYDITGQQLVNTRLPWGQALPRRADVSQIQHVFETGRPASPEILRSPLTHMPVASIAVPVLSGTKVQYVLATGIAPDIINNILTTQALPTDWVVAVLDKKGTIAARNRAPEAHVGQLAVPELRQYLVGATEGIHDINTREGIATVAAYSRSALSGWSVVIGIPRQGLEAQLWRSLMLLALGAVLLLGLSMGLAWFFGGRIAASVLALRASATALGNGTPLATPPVHLREADEVAQAMSHATRLLNERAQALAVSHEALVARDAELTDAHRIAKIGSWSWDIRTDAMRASPEMCRIFGLEHIPPFTQQDGRMFAHEAWLELRKARLAMAHTGLGYNLELPALHADGHTLWVICRTEVVRDPHGEQIGLHGTVQDITDRKQAELTAQSEQFIKAITEAIPGMVAYWDTNQCCKFANKGYLEWFGKTPEEVQGRTLLELLGHAVYALNEPYILGVLAGQTQQFERMLTRADGTTGYVLANYVPDVHDHGHVSGFFVLVTDVTPLKQAQNELKLSAIVFQNTAEAIMVTDGNGVILSVNPAFTKITGYTRHEAVGQTPRFMRSHRHEAQFHAHVWHQISTVGHWEGEIWNRRKSGEFLLVWQTIERIPGADSGTGRYVSVFHDVTDSFHETEKIKHLAFHDTLTTLPNRTLFIERLERHIASAQREPLRLAAVLFLDLDHFKPVNDTLGHAIGDELLIALARKLNGLVRQSDTVARFGGDEFVVLLDNPANQEEVALIAERVIAVMHEPMEIQGHPVQVGASVGIAMYPENGTTALELMKSADAAMYAAKRAGKNRYQFATVDVHGIRG